MVIFASLHYLFFSSSNSSSSTRTTRPYCTACCPLPAPHWGARRIPSAPASRHRSQPRPPGTPSAASCKATRTPLAPAAPHTLAARTSPEGKGKERKEREEGRRRGAVRPPANSPRTTNGCVLRARIDDYVRKSFMRKRGYLRALDSRP
ncbi:hypothetical protein PMAYCL1PPCAC_03516, partial [Pristionchus mayeri]